MGSRRLDISSLLCSDDPPADNPHSSRSVPEPVVLAPHLRIPGHPPSRPPPSSPTLRRPLQDADLLRPFPDQPRPHPAPRAIDSLIHPPSHSPADQPRPASSTSLAARSPPVFAYPPPVLSPTLSPLPPHQQPRPSASPLASHRPTSSHTPLSQPRHTLSSVSHRSRSHTTSAASPTVHHNNMGGPLAALEALVHAATEERKRLSASSPADHSPRHLPSTHSPHHSYRPPQHITSPSLPRHPDYPPVLPTSHVLHHRTISHNNDPRSSPSSATPYSPLALAHQQYEEEQRRLALQERDRIEQRRLEQQQFERQRLSEQRKRDDEYREKRIQEERIREQQEDLARRLLEEQQRLERERLRAEEVFLERRKLERQLELEEQRRREQEIGLRNRAEEEIEIRRRAEEEHRRHKELYEEEIRRRAEQRRLEGEREHRLLEERRKDDTRRREDELRQLEEQRIEEQHILHLQREQHERQLHASRLRTKQEAQERQASQQRQQDAHTSTEQRPQSVQEDMHHPAFTTPPTHSVTPYSPLTTIQLPQPVRPYPPISGSRKSDPIPIKRPANHDHSTPHHLSMSAPFADGERPAKKQRHSVSPPPSSTEPYPRVVSLPSPVSADFPLRPSSSAVRRPGSGQGKRQVHAGPGDAAEKERERLAADGHRIISSVGRRSPPGSQIGRATAAKKSDEARRADELAAAAAIADVRKLEESHFQVKQTGDKLPPSTSPIRSEPKKISQERGPPVIAIAHESPIAKIEEIMARQHSSDDTSRKMSLDVVMNDATVDVPVVKKESPLATSFDPPSRSKEQQPKKEVTPRLPRDDQPKSTPSRVSEPSRIVLVDVRTLPTKPQESRETGDVSPNQPERQQKDPHEWLLDHYAQTPFVAHQSPPEPPRSLSPSISPLIAKTQLEKRERTPPVENQKPTITLRSVSPDADAALERELAELMAEEDESVPLHKHEPDDMDIDLAVAEILEEDEKRKVTPMEVDGTDDVEDELLSLLDDRLPLPTTTIASAGHKDVTPTVPAAPFKPLPSLKTTVDDIKHMSPPAPTIPTAPSPTARPHSTCPGSDRGSMPPHSASLGKDKDEEVAKKVEPIGVTSAQGARKKKDVGNKAVAKKSKDAASFAAVSNNKQQKAKVTAPKKTKPVDGVPTPSATADVKALTKQPKSLIAKKPSAARHITDSRSRSSSVKPAGSVEPELERKSEEKEEKEDVIDDKLYCVCKTKYDEDRFMIACDRCDEWYHTTCVNMPEMEVELVDQFFCPPCIEQNPLLSLKTTYKKRCLNGLRHPDPDSPKACHKPARGAISKYCSDECGVEYMQSRIDAWAKKGGKREELWESVKNAEKREGITVCVDEKVKSDLDKRKKKQTKMDRETERLQGLLNQVVKMREEIKSSMEILVWRERLLQLASERAEHTDQCGWDQRLCFGEEEWQDYGAGVLESYDAKDENEMQVEDGEEDPEWWCPAQKSCKRHNGWQTLRYKDICKEREKKEELLTKLTTRERQLRKRIEDLTDPSDRKLNDQAPLRSSNTKFSDGHAKSRGTTEILKKGKKRKVPTS